MKKKFVAQPAGAADAFRAADPNTLDGQVAEYNMSSSKDKI